MAITPDGYRPSTPEELAEDSRHILAPFQPKPLLVPYDVWSREIDGFCRDRERRIALVRPENIVDQYHHGLSPITVEVLLCYQEDFYRETYADPTFTIDRAKLALPRERLDDIKSALLRGEVDYPLVTCLPRTLTREELGIPDVNDIVGGLPGAYTLHRVLLDRLIRQRNIAVWQRTDPIVDDFLEQVRDLTTTDLTRSDLTDTDGNPVAFNETTWLPYLQALYPTLPRPTATPRYLDLSFVKWEQDPPATRIIHGVHGPRGGQVTIQEKSQLDAVSFRYPLITPSRHLALFSQYHAATGQCLDTSTWSWTFGMIDPQRFPDRPSVNLDWHSDELNLYLNVPGYANVDGRLRAVR